LRTILSRQELEITGACPSFPDKVVRHFKASPEYVALQEANKRFLGALLDFIPEDPALPMADQAHGLLSDYASLLLQTHGDAGATVGAPHLELHSAVLATLYLGDLEAAPQPLREALGHYMAAPAPSSALSSAEEAFRRLTISDEEEPAAPGDLQAEPTRALLGLTTAAVCLFKQHASFQLMASQEPFTSWPASHLDVTVRLAMRALVPILANIDTLVRELFPLVFTGQVSAEQAWRDFSRHAGSYIHPYPDTPTDEETWGPAWQASITEFNSLPPDLKNLMRTGRPLPSWKSLLGMFTVDPKTEGVVYRVRNRHEHIALVASFSAFTYLRSGAYEVHRTSAKQVFSFARGSNRLGGKTDTELDSNRSGEAMIFGVFCKAAADLYLRDNPQEVYQRAENANMDFVWHLPFDHNDRLRHPKQTAMIVNHPHGMPSVLRGFVCLAHSTGIFDEFCRDPPAVMTRFPEQLTDLNQLTGELEAACREMRGRRVPQGPRLLGPSAHLAPVEMAPDVPGVQLGWVYCTALHLCNIFYFTLSYIILRHSQYTR
jgi:hypothetical protein